MAKAPLMLALAVWLTVAPNNAFHVAHWFAQELMEGGELWIRLGQWLQQQLSSSFITRGAILAWLDAISTAAEAVLLLLGKAWGEWLVVLGLAMLLPFEMLFLVRRPSWTRLLVLAANVAVVAYLARRRLRHAHKGLKER
jgi:uncharacterized membrane protein (DUF2068 family)